MLQEHTDVAVVGAGMSGLAIASELTRLNVDYLALEAGANSGTSHIRAKKNTISLAHSADDAHFVPFFSAGERAEYPRTAGYRSRVGGRSLYWRGICLRIDDRALEDWPSEVRDALEGDTGLYAQVERDLARWSGQESLAEPLTTDERGLVSWLNLQGVDATPTPRAIRVLGDHLWEAYSPLHDVPNDSVRAHCRVTAMDRTSDGRFRLTTQGGKTEGVVCRRVVLCAGVFENLRLVGMIQGFRKNETFEVTDHLVGGMIVHSPSRSTSTVDSSAYLGFQPEASSNVVLEVFPDPAGSITDLWSMAEQPVDTAFACTFDDDRLVVALDAEKRRLIGERHAQQVALIAETAERLTIPISSEPPRSHAAAVELSRLMPGIAIRYEAKLGELDHENGGLHLGGRVVNLNGQLRGAGEVYVAGPSLFPRAGAANPTLTNLALARYIAGNFN